MRRWIPWAGLVLGLCAGCGGSGVDAIKLVPVAGTVTLDGKPLAGATISFVPEASAKDATPGGDITGADGSFKASYRNRSGLAPGKYKVVVAKPAGGAQGDKPVPPDLAKSGYMAGLASGPRGGAGNPAAAAEWKYGLADTSPLQHTVSASGDTGLTFDLKSSLK